jgi:hypothetical protein
VRKTLFDRAVAPLLGLLFIDSLANEEIDPELKELVEDVSPEPPPRRNRAPRRLRRNAEGQIASTHSDASSQPAAALASDEMTKRITDLVNAGKYLEAQALTTGLLVAYPNDERLIQTQALLKQLVPTAAVPSTPGISLSAQPATGADAGHLTGMDKVDYNALIERARQAQQTTDPEQQKSSLQRFLSDSSLFLQKHPEQMLLWQIRAAAAISVNDPDAGYEAAQKLLAAGAVDSNDAALQRLLGQLKNNGWLDKQGVESFKRYAWIVGTWSVSWSVGEKADQHGNGEKEVFSKSGSGAIEGFYLSKNGHKNRKPNMRGAVLASQVSWTQYFDISDKDPESPGGHSFIVDDAPGRPYYPSGWQPPVSYSLSDDKRTMTMLFPQQSPKRNNKFALQHPVTLVFEKVSDLQ